MSVIGIITDFGLRDYFVPSMKGVILSINPKATIVDITQQIPKHDIEKGGFVLANSVETFPHNSVFLAVIDPGVGTKRECIVVRTENGFSFVGPDNGVFDEVSRRYKIDEIRKIENEGLMREQISNTFHGRDIMAPVAAHLSKGKKMSKVGPEISEIKKLNSKNAEVKEGEIRSRVVNIDDFGNLVTNVKRDTILGKKEPGSVLEIEIGNKKFDAALHEAFAEVEKGGRMCYIGSANLLEIAKNQGDLAKELGLEKTDRPDIKIKL